MAHLRNIDEDLAKTVADGLRLKEMPKAAKAARPTIMDLAKSPKLSILLNGPESFKGRKIGVLVTDGVDGSLLAGLEEAVMAEGAMMEIVAPMIGGVKTSDGRWIKAKQKIDGGPSLLYDAVAVLTSKEGLRHRRLRPLQVHRLFERGDAPVRESRHQKRSRRRLCRSRCLIPVFVGLD